MDTPKNTVGTQVTGQERDDLPDHMPGAMPEADEASDVVERPSEVDHPHARSADHLRPAAPVHQGDGKSNETSGSRPGQRPSGGVTSGTTSGSGPRTGIGRGQ